MGVGADRPLLLIGASKRADGELTMFKLACHDHLAHSVRCSRSVLPFRLQPLVPLYLVVASAQHVEVTVGGSLLGQ